MVVSVTGTVDAVPVTFTETVPGRWDVVVPEDLTDGKYIVDVTATDAAGNQTRGIYELYIYKHIVTEIRLIQQKYATTLKAERFNALLINGKGGKMQRDFKVGEKKYIDFEVSSTDGSAFTITAATYDLMDYEGDLVEHGNCTINAHKLNILLESPLETGRYVLKVWYTVPPEVRGERVIVNVT